MLSQQRTIPTRRMSSATTPAMATMPGLLPSKRVSKVKPVAEYDSITELQVLRDRTLQHLGPTCPQAVQQQVKSRVAEIDVRIRQLTNVNTVTLDVEKLKLEDPVAYSQAGPSVSRPSPARWNSVPSSTTGSGGTGSPVSPLNTDVSGDGMDGLESTSPTSPLFSLASKARIASKPLIAVQPHKFNGSRVQPMDLQETMRRGQTEYEQGLAHRQAVEARRAEKAALVPPSEKAARAMGLTEEQKRAKILAFMNFKGDSDDEDDEEDDDDDEFHMTEKYGEFGDGSEDEMSEGEDPVYTDMLSDVLSGVIKVDTSRLR